MAYDIFLSSNTLTPFLQINDNTEDTSSASVAFIGKNLLNYGQAQNQNFLWMLENFANGGAPSSPLVGQLWYDKAQSELKVYKGSTVWRKVGAPQAQATSPVSPDVGQLWYDTVNNVIKAWSGSSWIVVGPTNTVPTSALQQFWLTNTTTNTTITECWVNGVVGSRMTIPNNTTWSFEATVTARRTDSGTEYAGYKITGVINNTSTTVAFAGTPSVTTLGATSSWSVAASADNTNDSLNITVQGQAGKVINWSAVVSLYIV